MPPTRLFLDLPLEIRHAIYAEYFTADGGYVYNFKTRKLEARSRDGVKQPIDQALRLTCNQVAIETQGFALNVNIINFSADYSDEMRINAARLGHCLTWGRWLVGRHVRGPSEASGMDIDDIEPQNKDHETERALCSFTESILEEVILEFPKVEKFLRAILANDPLVVKRAHCLDWGLAPSYIYRALFRVYELSVKYDTYPKHWYPNNTGKNIFDRGHEHWAPPKMVDHLKNLPFWNYILPGKGDSEVWPLMLHQKSSEEFWERPRHFDCDGIPQYTEGKYRFSAAAAAAKFLSQFPPYLRMQLRKIHLHENGLSVAMPECHALGLIQYCQENQLLRVERRVDLWKTVWLTPNTYHQREEFSFEGHWMTVSSLANSEGGESGLSSYMMAHALALWITEALELSGAGMPKGSFTLILDAGPVSQQCSELFDTVIQRSAVWHKVYEVICERPDPDPNVHWVTDHWSAGYMFAGFFEAFQDLAGGRCDVVKTTFDIGPMVWNVETELKKYGHMSRKAFNEFTHSQIVNIEPASPMPSYLDLVAENILPQFWEERELETDPDSEFAELVYPGSYDDDDNDDDNSHSDARSDIGNEEDISDDHISRGNTGGNDGDREGGDGEATILDEESVGRADAINNVPGNGEAPWEKDDIQNDVEEDENAGSDADEGPLRPLSVMVEEMTLEDTAQGPRSTTQAR